MTDETFDNVCAVLVVVILALPFLVLILAMMFHRPPEHCPRCLSTKRTHRRGECSVFPESWTDYCAECGKYLGGVKPDGLL